MKRKKEMTSYKLSFLYLDYIFNKITIIIFSLGILFIIVSLLFIANPNLDLNDYLKNSLGYHNAYFVEALIVLSLFNSVIITTVVILLMIQSNSFDVLFIGTNKRIKISLAKVITGPILFLVMSLIEFIILYIYPILIFKNYQIEFYDLLTIIYLFLSMSFTYFFEVFLTNLISSIFIPMICLFLSLVKLVMTQAFNNIKDILSYIIPIIEYDEHYILNSIYVTPLWLVFFITIFIFTYNIKDIKLS